jgi:hypothetical protein
VRIFKLLTMTREAVTMDAMMLALETRRKTSSTTAS